MNEYIRAFVIGSSFFVFLPFFYIVSHFNKKKINFTYKFYSFLAPFSLGLMNVISLVMMKKYYLTRNQRFLFISIIAPTCVLGVVLLFKTYNFSSKNEWIRYIIGLYLIYVFVWNFIVKTLDIYV